MDGENVHDVEDTGIHLTSKNNCSKLMRKGAPALSVHDKCNDFVRGLEL